MPEEPWWGMRATEGSQSQGPGSATQQKHWRERTAAGCSLAGASAQHMPVFTTFSIKKWTEGQSVSVYPDIPTGAGVHVLYSTCCYIHYNVTQTCNMNSCGVTTPADPLWLHLWPAVLLLCIRPHAALTHECSHLPLPLASGPSCCVL